MYGFVTLAQPWSSLDRQLDSLRFFRFVWSSSFLCRSSTLGSFRKMDASTEQEQVAVESESFLSLLGPLDWILLCVLTGAAYYFFFRKSEKKEEFNTTKYSIQWVCFYRYFPCWKNVNVVIDLTGEPWSCIIVF